MALIYIKNKIHVFLILITIMISCSGKKSGDYQNEFWPDGSPRIAVSEQTTFLDGKLLVVKFYKENQKDTNSYILEKYYDNGQIAERGEFVNGKREGLWNMWYKNGNRSVTSNYKDGIRVGYYKSWYPNGELLEEFEDYGTR